MYFKFKVIIVLFSTLCSVLFTNNTRQKLRIRIQFIRIRSIRVLKTVMKIIHSGTLVTLVDRIDSTLSTTWIHISPVSICAYYLIRFQRKNSIEYIPYPSNRRILLLRFNILYPSGPM